MKDLDTLAGHATLELPNVTRPGRKPKGERPMSPAERQRAFRNARLHVNLGETMSNTVRRLAENFDITIDEVMQHLTRFALCNRNWDETGFPKNTTKEHPKKSVLERLVEMYTDDHDAELVKKSRWNFCKPYYGPTNQQVTDLWMEARAAIGKTSRNDLPED